MVAETEKRPEHMALVALDAELARRRETIESSAASLIDPDRMRGVVLAAFSRTPGLWECDPVTVVRAVVEAAQLGLEPTGAIGGAHLVPYWNSKRKVKECQLIIDYRGYVELARRSGEIAKVEARVVREADEFEFAYGTDSFIRHVPVLTGDPGAMTHVYAIATYRSGANQFDVMTAAEIAVIRNRSKSRDREGNLVGPWVSDEFEMSKKTVVRRLSKLLPVTVEVRRVIAEEEEFEAGPTRAAVVDRSARLRSGLQARLAAGKATETPEESPPPVDEPETDAECNAELAGEFCGLPAGHEGPHKSEDGVWPQDPPNEELGLS